MNNRNSKSAPYFGAGLLAAVVITAIDLASKWLIVDVVLDPPRVIPVASFFKLALVYNRGISFGLFGNLGSWTPIILSAVAFAIIVLLTVWLRRASRVLEAAGIAMVIGGAAANLVDRLRDGAVTDFLVLLYGRFHWPAFNLADVAISLGAAGLMVAWLRKPTGAESKHPG